MIPGCYKCRRYSTDECPHENEESTKFNACDLFEEQGGNVAKPDACPQLAEVRAIAEQSLNNLPYGFTAESETTNLISALLRIIDITKS